MSSSSIFFRAYSDSYVPCPFCESNVEVGDGVIGFIRNRCLANSIDLICSTCKKKITVSMGLEEQMGCIPIVIGFMNVKIFTH
jgi:hypothetical protein